MVHIESDSIPTVDNAEEVMQSDRKQLHSLQLTQYQGLVIMARHLEDYDLAFLAAQSAMAYAEEPLDFLMLYQHLAVIHCELGRYRTAQHCLEQITKLVLQAPEWVRCQIVWAQSRINVCTGKIQEAAAMLQDLLQVEQADPTDHLLIFCDLAQVLGQLGDAPTLRLYAAKAARVATRLEATPAARHLVVEFLRHCQSGLVSQEEVEAARHGLKTMHR